MTTRTFPLHCIVPPHILRAIAERGDPEQRASALRTLSVSERLRGRRETLGGWELAAPAGGKRRSVYDAQGRYGLPGRLVRDEGGPAGRDHAVNEAYEGAGTTYDLFRDVYGRQSLDDRGMRLDATVHYGADYDNAFWNGSQMVYGDGDGVLFGRFTSALEVIGHELTHGVIQHEAAFEYRDQPGALNESFADVFGSLVKQRALGQTVKEADWLIGKGLFTRAVKGKAIRSLAAPGTAYDDDVLGRDPQPSHMRGYVDGDDDNGNVHVNSGIPNHAFYLAAMVIGGRAWERAGEIWYVALRDHLRRAANFARAATATIEVAERLHGSGSREHRAVRDAWGQVGVEPRAPSPRPHAAGALAGARSG
jgi:Zn-dependent metalloprotease